jgi:hypothetical protein
MSCRVYYASDHPVSRRIVHRYIEDDSEDTLQKLTSICLLDDTHLEGAA